MGGVGELLYAHISLRHHLPSRLRRYSEKSFDAVVQTTLVAGNWAGIEPGSLARHDAASAPRHASPIQCAPRTAVRFPAVAALGRFATYLRKRSKADNEEDLKQIVAGIMDNQEEAANGD